MKEITSKKTGKVQIIPDSVWDVMVEKGFAERFAMTTLVEKKLKDVPIIPPEIKTTTKKKTNGEKD